MHCAPGVQHLLGIGMAESPKIITTLPNHFSQCHKLCSFLPFWTYDEDRKRHAADAGARLDLRGWAFSFLKALHIN